MVVAVMAQLTPAQVSGSRADQSIFPLEYSEEQVEHLPRSQKFHRCMSFGEAASVITIDRSISDFFKLFYRNSLETALEWFVYPNIP